MELTSLVLCFRKLDPLGKEFNTISCSVTGFLLFIEVQKGKERMKHSKYLKDIGATAACTKRTMKATKGISQNSIKGWTKDYFLFDGWFASKKAKEAAMEVAD